jgi:hypothetical protein
MNHDDGWGELGNGGFHGPNCTLCFNSLESKTDECGLYGEPLTLHCGYTSVYHLLQF